MSQENVEIVRDVVEAQRRRDWQGSGRCTTPASSGTTIPDFGGIGERDADSTLFETRGSRGFEAFDRVSFEIENVVTAGDEVVTSIRISARGRVSGLVTEQRIPTVWTVQRGRVVRVRGYRDEAEALEAVGLRE